ncbi:hypothetical protein KUTeg_009091 [Tegillarca granosa]|uniref:Uncharacterized protein n=1 Tax=Tegillarca granosa TaxID=220873 RepID=A0ABQ9FCD6_TEGGR|nr:hypothetical protein KUTeg_009091 [Tegillarca granosa]
MLPMEENYVQASVPVESTTSYIREFIPKQLLPEIRRVEPRNNYITTSARFDGQTTTKDHFKQWVTKPVVSFGELPSFTGSILYPKKEILPESCTKESFKGEFAPRPDAIRLAESNIKLEGKDNVKI